METTRHGVWKLNTSRSPLNTAVWDTSRLLIMVYDTVSPALKHMKLRIFSLRLLWIRLKTSLNRSGGDRPARCLEPQYKRIAAQHRSMGHPLHRSSRCTTPSTPLSNIWNFRFFPLDFYELHGVRFWLKTNSNLIFNTYCWLAPPPPPTPHPPF